MAVYIGRFRTKRENFSFETDGAKSAAPSQRLSSLIATSRSALTPPSNPFTIRQANAPKSIWLSQHTARRSRACDDVSWRLPG